jgi:broad specificity phosphatase PhoE
MHLKIETPIEYNPLFAERRNPSEIIGQSIDNPEVKKIVNMIDHSYHDDTYRFSDEENFTDLRDRARDCLAYLETLKEKKVLVVTHGIFLKMLIAYMLYRENLTAAAYNKLSFFNPSNNAGVTVCELTKGLFNTMFGAPKPEERWELIAWDNHVELKGKNTTI